jgi:putative CocE/NonD family hydrolase
LDFSEEVARVIAPVHLLGGWYDVFLPRLVADYERLRQAGRRPYLTIGPWAHTSQGLMPVAMRESIAWFRAHLLGDRSALRDAPVRVFVMGAGEWRDFPEWPPTGYQEQRWHLQPGGGLSTSIPAASEPDHYRYDPADPTPAVGGSSLSKNSGPQNNRALEARRDVLVYTSAPLDSDLTAIGPVAVELHVTSSLDHTDFFARLCDVDPAGKSINVCDGLIRLLSGRPSPDEGGCRKVRIELWPTAYRFKRGHSLRVQVSSGAHPRFARNLGSGEPLATATTLVVADQSVAHDPAHPSAIFLPVMA